MALFLNTDFAFHEGELHMIKQLKVPDSDNPTVPALSPQLSNHLSIVPLIAIGTVDSEGWPWTTLWGGQKGMAQPLGGGIIGIKTPVTGKYDPVVEELVGKEAAGTVIQEEGEGRMVSGLTIDLETRKRTKLYGRMITGALLLREDEVTGRQETVATVQLVLKIEQSLGNCPKYVNKKAIEPALSKPELISDSLKLPQEAIDLIEKADLFFVSSAQNDKDMDTNHRGGPPGFFRVASNEDSGAILCWPEYSGNRLYQTLGNLVVNPKAGICIPDFDTGAMLYLTGSTEILVGAAASAYLPRSNLLVKFTVTASRLVLQALPFRGIPGDQSPYNPPVRLLASEKAAPRASSSSDGTAATLLTQTPISPTISTFTFSLPAPLPPTYTPGQYITLDFSEHLDIGYTHMRNNDPQAINDDFIRTFTVSRAAGSEFDITMRKVGSATGFLFSQGLGKGRMSVEVGVKGFGGEFRVEGEGAGFVAAGVGITPLLASLEGLEVEKLRVWWSVRGEDVNFVRHVLERAPGLAGKLTVFVTGATDDELKDTGATVNFQRMRKEDLESDEHVSKFYICTSVPMRKQLTEWLAGKELVFEDFNF